MRRGTKTLGRWPTATSSRARASWFAQANGHASAGRLAVASVLAACAALAGCGGASKQIQPLAITAISPASIPAGTPGITLIVSGTDFNTGTFFSFGADSKIAPLSVQQQSCQTAPCGQIALLVIPPNDIGSAGTAKIVATTGGAHSNAVTFAITSPQIVTMSPLAVTAGGPGFNLTLEVVNAGPNVHVLFGKDTTPLVPSGPVTCNPLTACAVTVPVPKADIATAGPLTVTVSNPFATAGGTTTANFLLVSPGTAAFPALESSNGGTPANGASTHSSASDGGVYVAFDSTATNLPGGATSGHSEIYLTANCFGAANCTPGTTLISAGSGGAAGTGGVNGSDRPQISADGRFVVFESDDTNLASSGTQPVEQIYLFDSCNSIFGTVKNCTPGITLVSADSSGNEGNAASANPAISAFGLYVAYQSAATNLTSAAVSGGTQQIYLFLSCNGAAGAIAACTKGTQLVSFDQSGSAGGANSTNAAIDPLGMSVAFESSADNIVAGIAGNTFQQIYLRPTCIEGIPFLGPGCAQPPVLVSGTAGSQPGTGDSITPAMAAGPIVAYATRAGNLLPAASSNQQILAANICLALPATTQCAPSGALALSVDQNGNAGTADSSNPSVNGVTAAFTSLASLQTGAAGQQVYAATVCLPVMAPCAPTATVISASGGSNIGGDFASVGAGGFATFSSAGSSAALGTPEIFLATPPAPAGAVTQLRKIKPE
jgi:hypothetical protein